jgi:hypothetical protein
MRTVLGWDIGGVNTKAALVVDGRLVAVEARPFELQRAPASLVSVLHALAASLLRQVAWSSQRQTHADVHAVTMTAELSQLFRSKREGVSFVLDAVADAFPGAATEVYATDGRFLSLGDARDAWTRVAAANWSATARAVARRHRDAVLVDTGTTTTDVIPIVGGDVVAQGWTDPERLASGELVYTGVVRTPAEALAHHVWVKGRRYGVSAEGFALAGDVHVWRGELGAADYTVPTPDGRAADRSLAGERLRRVICADPVLADEAAVDEIARGLAGAQVARVADAVLRVRAAHPTIETAVVTGLGAFLAEAATRTAGLAVVRLADSWGSDAATVAPAAAVALLAAERAPVEPATATNPPAPRPSVERPQPRVDLVVKVGGSLLRHPAALDAVMSLLGDRARRARMVVVPGGGAFADAVRGVDGSVRLSPSAAHWAAIRGMDQCAEVLVDKCLGAALVADRSGIEMAHREGRLAVLAPHRWLRDADPLPHSWDVTGDSIAAWLAGALGAPRLVLVKAPGARGTLVDASFERVKPAGLETHIVAADETATLASRLAFG